MTDVSALQALLAKVEAGECPEAHEITAAFRSWYKGDEPVVFFIRAICGPDDIRQMGAAKALHEAVLPQCKVTIIIDARTHVTIEGQGFQPVHALHESPGRAFLIAILKALIAKETI